jgi:iron complex outermembrane receptor protein
LKRLRIGVGVRHFDSTFAYTSPALYGKPDTGDVTLVDAALGYAIDEQWSAELMHAMCWTRNTSPVATMQAVATGAKKRTLLATLTYDW